MSSLGLDPNDPLPHVDDDSDLVGKNDRIPKDPGQRRGWRRRKVEAAAMPVVGGMAVPIPATADRDSDDEMDDEQ
jgi:hypothetical protein